MHNMRFFRFLSPFLLHVEVRMASTCSSRPRCMKRYAVDVARTVRECLFASRPRLILVQWIVQEIIVGQMLHCTAVSALGAFLLPRSRRNPNQSLMRRGSIICRAEKLSLCLPQVL